MVTDEQLLSVLGSQSKVTAIREVEGRLAQPLASDDDDAALSATEDAFEDDD
jgi:hypothetical protein